MNNTDVKISLINSLSTLSYFKQVNDSEFRIRCPLCGDSVKNLNTGHMYIHINLNDNYPVVYNCFKCNEHGIFNDNLLTALDINDVNLKSGITRMNKTSDKVSNLTYMNNQKMLYFDYKRPKITRGPKTEYVEKRMGRKITDEEFSKMKLVTSLADFLTTNDIKQLTCDLKTAERIEDHFVGFVTYGNTHILFRDITDKDYFTWVKYPITLESKQSRILYSMETELDIMSNKKIIINLAEGALDIISANINLEYSNSNTMNLAVCGKSYIPTLKYLLSIGICGSNVELNIFADNDAQFNKKNKKPTTPEYFKYIFKKIKHLYGSVNIYYNIKSKDIGVPKEQIMLKKYKI